MRRSNAWWMAVAAGTAVLLVAAVLRCAPGAGVPASQAGGGVATQEERPLPEGGSAADGGTVGQEADGTRGEAVDGDDGTAHEVVSPAPAPAPAPAQAGGADAPAEPFVMPEGAAYDPEVALVSVVPGTTPEELGAALAGTGVVAEAEVSAEELASGVVCVELAQGVSVEDAVNALQQTELVESAQPDYLYFELADEDDLRAALSGAGDAAPVDAPQVEAAEADASADEPEPAAGVSLPADDPSPVACDVEQPADGSGQSSGSDGQSSGSDAQPTGSDGQPTGSDGQSAGSDEQPTDDEPSSDAADQTGEDSLRDALQVNDPYADPTSGNQWALASIRAYEAWARARCEHNVSIAILDNNPSVTHEDLAANVVATYDAHSNEASFSSAQPHGTHVAGIACAVANNALGVAGVSYNAGLVAVNVFYQRNGRNVTSTTMLRNAYAYLVEHKDDHHIRVANLSVGGTTSAYDELLVQTIGDAYDAGIVTVAAAGNSDVSAVPYEEFPGDVERVVSVINLEANAAGELGRYHTSNYNVAGQRCKNISAPGSGIYSTYTEPLYAQDTGTSMASPHVAGVLALEFAANPQLTSDEAVSVLYATAADLGAAGWDEEYGYGEVDACAAVECAADESRVAEAVARVGLRDDPDPEPAPEPVATGASRVPVGATAAYEVSDGTLRLKEGDAATLEGTTLTGAHEGTVTLALIDAAGVERSTMTVEVFGTQGAWSLQTDLASERPHVLDVADGSVFNGGNVQLWTTNGTRAQTWLFELQDDGSFFVRNAKSGKMLDVSSGSRESGANVQQWRPNGTPAQRWRLVVGADNHVTLVNAGSGMALCVADVEASRRANVLQRGVDGTAGQAWQLVAATVDCGPVWEGVYRVESALGAGLVLDVAGGSKARGANVRLWASNGTNAQRWMVEYLGEGAYRLCNLGSGLALDVADGALARRANLQQWRVNGTGAQTWELGANADGSYTIRRRGTSWVVDVANGAARSGANVQQWSTNATVAQRWHFIQY